MKVIEITSQATLFSGKLKLMSTLCDLSEEQGNSHSCIESFVQLTREEGQ